MSPHLARSLEMLERYGLLLESGAILPSVANLVAGEPVKGSWWGHPQGHAIFQVTRELAAHPDVLACKLVSGKVTFVHRKLWPAVVAVGKAREPWQLSGLGPEARSLLNRIEKQDRAQASGEPARDLERRLLVSSEQIHTAAGSHAKLLESWKAWAQRVGLARAKTTPQQAKQALEEALANVNHKFGGKGRLPWHDLQGGGHSGLGSFTAGRRRAGKARG